MYQHLLLVNGTSMLSGEQIRDGWLKHIYSDENTPFTNNEGEFDVDALANLTNDLKAVSVAVVDPVLLGSGGLKPPVETQVKACAIALYGVSPSASNPMMHKTVTKR